MGVVEHERAFGAENLHPGRAVVRIARRQVPAAADDGDHAVVEGHDREHHVVRTVHRLHVAVGALAVDAHGLGRLQQPEHEIEIVGRFHHHRRQPHAAGDLLAEAARQMPAHHHRDHVAERAVGDFLLGVGEFGVEALRIADGEFHLVALGELDQLVGFPQFERDRLFQEHVLAGFQAVLGDRIVVGFRRGRNIDHRNVRILDDVLVIERRGRRPRQLLHLRQPVGPDFADVQFVDQRGTRQRLRSDAAAPAGADHRSFNSFHRTSSFLFLHCDGARPDGRARHTMPSRRAPKGAAAEQYGISARPLKSLVFSARLGGLADPENLCARTADRPRRVAAPPSRASA